jgi:hypothetical protein
MAKPPDPSEHPDYRERRFTWEKGDLVLVKPGDGVPLMTPEQLDRLLHDNAEEKEARKLDITNVDYPPDEDVDYPDTERSKP